MNQAITVLEWGPQKTVRTIGHEVAMIMKALRKVVLTFITVTLVAGFALGLMFLVLGRFLVPDWEIPNEKEVLEIFPEIQPFLIEHKDFRGILWVSSDNYLSFAFHTNLTSSKEFFQTIQPRVTQFGWKLIQTHGQKQIYWHPVQQTKVTLIYQATDVEVICVVE